MKNKVSISIMDLANGSSEMVEIKKNTKSTSFSLDPSCIWQMEIEEEEGEELRMNLRDTISLQDGLSLQ